LAKRIQLTYAFDILSADLMVELDRLRSVRNSIAHNWNISSLGDFHAAGRLAEMHPVEKILLENPEVAREFPGTFEPLAAFRIRLVWTMRRFVYEAEAYYRAKAARLNPARALYGNPTPKWLSDVSAVAFEATRKVANSGV
jgi:hypothetical protein